MYADNGSEEGPRGTFESYRAEGDGLYKNGEFKKAIEAFTTALELQPGDKSCLVARSRCYLQLGDPDRALNDAEESLSDNKEFHKGLFQKAEALYCKGEFELALVFYHRGHKLRPELQEFRLGIQKAQEAIDNSVGSPDRVQLTKEGDLSFFHKQDEAKAKKPAKSFGSYNRQPTQAKQTYKKPAPRSASNDKTIKQLLGELYGDKIYLEKLMQETDPYSESGRSIFELVSDGLRYLDTRTDFWRQQKPMYARKRDRVQRKKISSGEDNLNSYIVKELEKIDEIQAEGKYQESLKRAKKCLKEMEKASPETCQNNRRRKRKKKPPKINFSRHASTHSLTSFGSNSEPVSSDIIRVFGYDVITNLYSLIGNSYLEMGQYDKALQNHQLDLENADKHGLDEAKSRAYDNLGRVYARMGEFQKAIDSWSSKLPMSKSPLETTWLYHEIGRCHLELGHLEQAKEFGEKSAVSAEEAEDKMWQLNSAVLIAQTEVKLKDMQAALQSFEKALDMAKLQGDEAAETAIKRAMQDVNNKIVQGLKDGEEPDGEQQKEEEGKTGEEEAAAKTEEADPEVPVQADKESD